MEKKCSKCGDSKPLDDFYKNKRGALGVSFYCKPCHNRECSKRVEKRTGKSSEPGTKSCTKCGELRPVDDFYPDASGTDGKRASCKICERAATMGRKNKKKAAAPTIDKECTKCKTVKPIDDFGTQPGRINGKSWCKLCDAENHKKPLRKPPEFKGDPVLVALNIAKFGSSYSTGERPSTPVLVRARQSLAEFWGRCPDSEKQEFVSTLGNIIEGYRGVIQ